MNNSIKPVSIDSAKIPQVIKMINKDNSTKKRINTNNYFTNNVKEEAIKRLLRDNPKAKRTGNTINFITCPICGRPEAYINFDKGFCILCHRLNNCGAKVNIKEIYPELYQDFNKRFPVTPKNPNATATAYLQSRGVNTDNLEYYQGKVTDQGKNYTTVYFKLAEKVTNHRLIDYTGKNKTRNFGSYKGLVYEAIANDTDDIYITEGIINAISLMQSGYNSIAIISSVTVPKEYYLKHKDKTFILAFDNDKAGKSATDKHIKFFKQSLRGAKNEL
jgi:hypothetical protein